MEGSIEVGRVSIVYNSNNTQSGRRPKCAVCRNLILPNNERITIRRSQHNDLGVRAPMYLCVKDARRVANSILRIIGE